MIEKGLWQHFRGGVYEVLGTASHTETQEELVIYKKYYSPTDILWARPASMWEDTVDGQQRFRPLGSAGDEIKPCPYCGQPGKISRTGVGNYYIRCDNVNCEVLPTTTSKKRLIEAIRVWNRRPLDE